MKRTIRRIAYPVAGLLLLLATAHFALRTALNTPKVKTALTGFIERATGRPADYGRIEYRLFPFSVVLRHAVLKEKAADEAPDFATIAAISARVDFRTREIAALQLERPTLRIVRRADGTFNFSDLLPAKPASRSGARPKPAARPDPAGPPLELAPPAAPGPPPAAAPFAPAFALRQVHIDHARIEFIREQPDGGQDVFLLPDSRVVLHDWVAGRPGRLEADIAIGKSSSLHLEFADSANPDPRRRPDAPLLALRARLDLRAAADLQALLPGAPPFENLTATLDIAGRDVGDLTVRLDLRTPAAGQSPAAALAATLRAQVSLPGPVARHLIANTPLPEEYQFAPPPCEPPPGTLALTTHPPIALLLRHARATAELAFPTLAWGQISIEHGSAALALDHGVLTISAANFATCGGTVAARGEIRLLECPLTYRIDRFGADRIDLGRALAAAGMGGDTVLSGALFLKASAEGQAVSRQGLRTLAVDAKGHVLDLQSVGTRGSPLDQAWRKLDNPLLLQWLPRLKTRVAQARQKEGTVVTTRYDRARADISLRDGVATLANARLDLPFYRLRFSGTIRPGDDRLDLAARLVASPEETTDLTDGQNLAAILPYEDGGLMVPLNIRGPLRKPEVQPDFDRLLQNALGGFSGGTNDAGAATNLVPVLDLLSASDRENVEQGLRILGDLLQTPAP